MKKMYIPPSIKLAGFSLLCLLFSINSFATPVSGAVGGQTWDIAGSPYVITGKVTVGFGSTLTINPGVTVQFPSQGDGGLTLEVNGTLLAIGKTDSTITFVGTGASLEGYANRRNKRGPVLIGSSSLNSVLDYVVVDGLGFGSDFLSDLTAAIDISSTSCSISNCFIRNVIGTGILFRNNSFPAVNNNTFNNNRVGLKFLGASPVVSNNTFSSTYLDVITGLDNLSKLTNNNPLNIGLTADIPMNLNDLIISNNTRYVVLVGLTVPTGKTLTIEAGSTIEFPSQWEGGLYLDILGKLTARGTENSYITFKGTGASLEGYANRRYKRGPVFIESSSLNSVLDYVVVDGLGFGSDFLSDLTAAIDISSTSCSISNCFIQNVTGTGILFRNNSFPAVNNNTFNNNRVGLKFLGASPVVSNNTFSSTYLDVITGLDNLSKLTNNNPLNIGLTADIPMNLNDLIISNNTRYVVLAGLTVPTNRTLTIEAGSTIEFPSQWEGGLYLDILGKLTARGTENSYITFKGTGASLEGYANRRHKRGPVFIESSSLNSVLDYVVVDGLGFGSDFLSDLTAAIDISSTSCSISNCYIQNIIGTGILFYNSATFAVTNNTFSNNRVGLKLLSTSPIVSNNTFSSTYLDVITGLDNLSKLINNNPLNIGMTNLGMALDDTITNSNIRYVLLDSLSVPAGRTLTIEPGSRVEFPSRWEGGLYMNIIGRLIAKGTLENYITFMGTGAALDGYSNRRNKRGPIFIQSSSLNSILQFIGVDNLGFGDDFLTDPSGVLEIRSSSCNVFNCMIRNARGTGITIQNSSPYIERTCFNNNRVGVFASGGSANIFHSNFEGNTFGIKNASGVVSDTIKAQYCWWGNPSGPKQINTNPNATGDEVSDKVLYNPWETSAPFDCGGPLPVTLLNFQVNQNGIIANCTWQTAAEINTSHFIVEHSITGTNFSRIGKLLASGNSSITKSYQFTDKIPNSGINFYRLKMVDIDGKYTYSKIVKVNISIRGNFTVYPNPVKDDLIVQLKNDKAGQVSLQIIDMLGKVLYQQTLQMQPGTTSLSIPTQLLSKGMYIIKITGNQAIRQKNFLKE